MSAGLLDQLESYYEQVDSGQEPIRPQEVATLVEQVRELPMDALSDVERHVRSGVWRAAATAALVLAVVGGAAWLLRSGTEVDPADQSPPPTAPPVSTTATLAPESSQFPVGSILYGVASNGEVLVAVGTDHGYCCGTGIDGAAGETGSAAVWTSTDGFEWERVPHDETLFGGGDGQIMRAVVATPFGFVAGGEDRGRTALWTSPDGTAWSRVGNGAIAGWGGASIVEILSWDGQVYAFGYSGTLVSETGESWELATLSNRHMWGGNVIALPDAIQFDAPVASVVDTDGGYIALGGESLEGGLSWGSAGLWRSQDGTSWEVDAVFGGSVAPGKVINDITSFRGSIIGVGVEGEWSDIRAAAGPVLVSPPAANGPLSDAGLIDSDNWTFAVVKAEWTLTDVEALADQLRTSQGVLDVMVIPSGWDTWYAAIGIDTMCLPGWPCGAGIAVLVPDTIDSIAVQRLLPPIRNEFGDDFILNE